MVDVAAQAEAYFKDGGTYECMPFQISIEVDRILLKAGTFLDQEGWIQDALTSHEKGYCVTGALGACTQHEPGSPLVTAAERRLAKTLRLGVDDLPTWNDHPQRTRPNVVWWLKFAVEHGCLFCDNLAVDEGCPMCRECCDDNNGVPEKYDLDGELVYEDHCHIHCELEDCDCWSAI